MVLLVATLITGFFIGPMKFVIGGWPPYAIPDTLTALIVITWFFTQRRRAAPKGRAPLQLAFLALTAYCLMELANPEAPFVRSVMGFRSLLLYTALYFVGFSATMDASRQRRLQDVLLALGAVAGLVALWQWQQGPAAVAELGGWYEDFSEVMHWNRESGDVVFRPFSTFVHPGVLSTNMAFLMLIGLGQLLARKGGVRRRALVSGAFLIMSSGLVVSGSRTSIVELLGGGLIMLWLRREIGSALKGSVALTVGVWSGIAFAGSVILERLFTIFESETYLRWMDPLLDGLDVAAQLPLGGGLAYTGGVPFFVTARWVQALPTRSVDSGIGSMAAELGFPGLIVYLAFLTTVAVSSLQSWRRLPTGPLKDLLAAPAVFGILAGMLSPLWNVLRGSLPFSIYYWFLLGTLAGAAASHRVAVRHDDAARSSSANGRVSTPLGRTGAHRLLRP